MYTCCVYMIHVVYIWYTRICTRTHTHDYIYICVYVYYVHIHPHARRNAHIHTPNMWSQPKCECDFEEGAQIYIEDTGVEFERLNECVEIRTRVCQDLPYSNPIRPRMETSHSSSHSTNRWCVVKCVWQKRNETKDKSQWHNTSHHIALQCRWCSNYMCMCVCDCVYICVCVYSTCVYVSVSGSVCVPALRFYVCM